MWPYAYLVSVISGHPFDWTTVLIVVGLFIGEKPGWGAPIGQVRGDLDPDRQPERYQKWFNGYMWEHPWVALFFRGFIWGLPTLQWEIILAFTVSFPLSVWLQTKYEPSWPKSWHLAWNEFYRGFLVGLIVWGLA